MQKLGGTLETVPNLGAAGRRAALRGGPWPAARRRASAGCRTGAPELGRGIETARRWRRTKPSASASPAGPSRKPAPWFSTPAPIRRSCSTSCRCIMSWRSGPDTILPSGGLCGAGRPGPAQRGAGHGSQRHDGHRGQLRARRARAGLSACRAARGRLTGWVSGRHREARLPQRGADFSSCFIEDNILPQTE